ncbi:MAG: aldolase [Dehalococcoidales bacterium]|nr:aldolase [Dehalococcoidales bacterium]
MFLNQFKNVGQALFNRGLVSSHSGNLSIKIGDRLIITRRECNLGALEERDLVETGINKNDRATPLASGELQIHRAIYQNTPARAIVHAHPIHAIALSMTEKVISSDHLEEFCALGRVPVVGTGTDVRAPDLTDNLVEALKGHRIAVVYGHGSFAVGQLLDEAFNCTTGLEEACEILCLMKSMQIKISPDK